MTFNIYDDYEEIQNTFMEQASEDKVSKSTEKKHFKSQYEQVMVSGPIKGEQTQVSAKALSENKKRTIAKSRKARRTLQRNEDIALSEIYTKAQNPAYNVEKC